MLNRRAFLAASALGALLITGPASAAIVSQTVNFGSGGTGNFNFTGMSSGQTVSQGFTSGSVTVTVTLGVDTADDNCAGSTAESNCRIFGSSTVPTGLASAGVGVGDVLPLSGGTDQIDEGELLQLRFSHTVTITQFVFANVDSGDGAIVNRVTPSAAVVLSIDPLSGAPLTGDTYNVANEWYNTGVQVFANGGGTVFNIIAHTGGTGSNDFYLQSITFSFDDVPEPATYALFGGGLAALALMRRLRARRG